MKTAVVYYSMSGNVKNTAEKIAEKLSADLIELKPEKTYPDKGFKKFFWGGKSAVMGEKPKLLPYEFESEKYERIIFGSPVWASNVVPPLRTFIEENRDNLKNKSISVFMCMSGSGGDKAISKLRAFLDVEKFESELILIDPKDKPSEENEEKINSFCSNLE
ncbi:MAG: flavodoxin family protein [Clostridiales bacterium]|nr:flavodoxin family protein [Clostridiales bacterium]